MFKLKNIIIISLLAILMIPLSVTAWYVIEIHLLSTDLVDSGKHLDWAGSTTYMSQLNIGIGLWNNYKNGIIRKDTILTIADVTVSDVDLGANGIPASTNMANKTIKLNLYYMNTGTNNAIIHVYAHEFGHALGIYHQPLDISAIMYYEATETVLLNANDRANYDAAYSRY